MKPEQMPHAADYFVSLCLAQESNVTLELQAIWALAKTCGRHLRYWEIVYVVGESNRSPIHRAIAGLPAIKNLRIVLVRAAVGYYRRRVVAATEAIGDVVVLTSFNEVAAVDVSAFAAAAAKDDQVVIGHRTGSSSIRFFTHWL